MYVLDRVAVTEAPACADVDGGDALESFRHEQPPVSAAFSPTRLKNPEIQSEERVRMTGDLRALRPIATLSIRSQGCDHGRVEPFLSLHAEFTETRRQLHGGFIG